MNFKGHLLTACLPGQAMLSLAAISLPVDLGRHGDMELAYVNPSNPDQSANPDLSHPAPVGPHWDYTDRNKTNPGWRVYPGGQINKK